jgi:hypothetical protein
MMLQCPGCKYNHDISGQTAGNRIWCAFCDRWLMLSFHHHDGSAYFVVVQAPVS